MMYYIFYHFNNNLLFLKKNAIFIWYMKIYFIHLIKNHIIYIIKVRLRHRDCAKWLHQTEEILLDF